MFTEENVQWELLFFIYLLIFTYSFKILFIGYDIRASINNLQFAALKSSQEKQRDAEGKHCFLCLIFQ